MPSQEIFLRETDGARTLEVVKTYDHHFARQAFEHMDDFALDHLLSCLNLEANCDEADIPSRENADFEDFVWEEVLESARESGNALSFFVVGQSAGGTIEPLFVSPDWPTAEAFFKLVREMVIVHPPAQPDDIVARPE